MFRFNFSQLFFAPTCWLAQCLGTWLHYSITSRSVLNFIRRIVVSLLTLLFPALTFRGWGLYVYKCVWFVSYSRSKRQRFNIVTNVDLHKKNIHQTLSTTLSKCMYFAVFQLLYVRRSLIQLDRRSFFLCLLSIHLALLIFFSLFLLFVFPLSLQPLAPLHPILIQMVLCWRLIWSCCHSRLSSISFGIIFASSTCDYGISPMRHSDHSFLPPYARSPSLAHTLFSLRLLFGHSSWFHIHTVSYIFFSFIFFHPFRCELRSHCTLSRWFVCFIYVVQMQT